MVTEPIKLSEGDWYDCDIAMRWADSDMLKHMNNAVYFRLMEEARIQMLAAAEVCSTSEEGVVVVHCACDYLKPITYPATVRVRHVVEKVGRTSLTHTTEFYVLGDLAQGPYARGRSVMVRVTRPPERPVPWPEAVLDRLAIVCVRQS
uniref:acyl-CoA thioesterase n=1 Tax=Orrella sp. TaxID=1921583 RepID=UPI0040554CC8